MFSARAPWPSTLSLSPCILLGGPWHLMANPACVARFTQGLLFVNEEKLKNAAIEVLVLAQ